MKSGILTVLATLAAFTVTLFPAAARAQMPSSAAPLPPENTRLLRFPATNDIDIVFSYAGQLYTVPVAGGVARRLTDGPGYAVFPKFSADGKLLAFTAQYDGNTEVYVMPAGGGAPRRLTFSAAIDRDDLSDRMGPNNIVMAWRNTANEITYRARASSWDPFVGQLMSVNLDGNLPAQLPVPRGGFMTYSPDDTKIAYNRIFREFRTWKNYKGGMADDIWIYDLKTGALENITDNPSVDDFPMWAANNRVYFLSERTGRANLFVYDPADPAAKQHPRQLTAYTDYDVKFPSLGKNSIVYEQGGLVWRFDLATEKAAPVPIIVREDLASARPVIAKIPPGKIASLHSAPDGQRVVVSAHGDIFTVPLKDGPTRNLTQTPAVHERDAVWSPDGKMIAYLSDATGEFELYARPQNDPAAAPVQLTGVAADDKAGSYYFAPVWSPDSKKILLSDRLQRLFLVDVAAKTKTIIAENKAAMIREYAWSPDSTLVAWTREAPEQLPRIEICRVAGGPATAQSTVDATDGWYAAASPVFSDDGKWLLFTSARDFAPIYSDVEWNYAYQNMQRVYMLALSKDTQSPLAPRSDEVGKKSPADSTDQPDQADRPDQTDQKNPKTGAADKPPAPPPPSHLDADGLASRIVALPIEPANYGGIRMVGDRVFYRRAPGSTVSDDGRATAASSARKNLGDAPGAGEKTRTVIAAYDFKERKETVLGNYDDFEITADGKRMLVRDKNDYAIIDLPKEKIEIKDKLDLSQLQLLIDRQAEWAQIFNESWRQMRDFFYAPNMHGVGWPEQRDKYAKLLPYVANRYDLTYIIGEMIGELHVGHSYVGGGDLPAAPRTPVGLLGAQLARDAATGYYQITKILRGANWNTSIRSPLTELGVNAREGDYILAIDGKTTRDMANPYAALVGTVGRQVTLRLASKPDAAAPDARDTVVVPIADESLLYYETWVQNNIAHVAERTNGRVGYVHIPDMEPYGLNEFVRHFYPQIAKEALIIDVRSNGGGSVSPMIIERLRRELAFVEMNRNGAPQTSPPDMVLGPKIALMDECSASDGDIFPYRFRAMGLGKLVGKRSWGGVVGIDESQPFMDGGFLNTPSFSPFSKDGKSWIIEGHGVDPDIVVDNAPDREFRGEDQQLDAAIDEILLELKTNNPKLPPTHPDWPVKPAK